MEATGKSLDELSAQTQSWARQQSELVAVLLFGSRAKGTATPYSDWDVCCVVDSPNTTSWYGTWFFHADAWKEGFCQATGLPADRVQFVAPTSPQVRQGLSDCSRVLYLRASDSGTATDVSAVGA